MIFFDNSARFYCIFLDFFCHSPWDSAVRRSVDFRRVKEKKEEILGGFFKKGRFATFRLFFLKRVDKLIFSVIIVPVKGR